MRSKQSAFKECTDCKALRLEYAEGLRNRLMPVDILKIKASMKKHRDWWQDQRFELDRLRRQGARNEVVFGQSDACGKDCVYVPGEPRVSTENASEYNYRMKLQANCYSGSHFTIMLVLPQLGGGANFGATCDLHSLRSMIERGFITSTTRRYIHSTDGGSENRNKITHDLYYMLVLHGVFDEIIWARLPPSHSHDFVDRVFSAVEDWLHNSSHRGCPTPRALRDFLTSRFDNTDSKYAGIDVLIDFLVRSFDFVVCFYGCIDVNKLMVKERTRPNGTKYRPVPLVWRYKWCPERKRVLTHYKTALNDFATPEQDE
jgi:hypothetical protein